MGTIFQEIPLRDIELSGDNKRRIDEKTEEFQAMVANVKAAGIVQPVHVRPHPKKKGKFELRAGERRYRAGRAAGLEMIPALIADADDQAAVLITLTENQHRLDLGSIEEAEQIALTVDRFGGDVKAVATRIGKDEKWVRVRVNVVGHLAKCWRNIFASLDKHPMFQTWSLTHLALIARLPEHIQVDLHKLFAGWHKDYEKVWGCSVKDLEEIIGGSLHLLSKSKWSLDDETLVPKAGACTECPKRSGHQPALWFEMADQAKAGDECLDVFCWQGKSDAWLKRRAKEYKDQHGGLTLITCKDHEDYNERERLENTFGSFMDKYAYKIVSKSTQGALPAMYISGAAAGQLTYIKPTATQSGSGTRSLIAGRATPLKERQVMLDAKRWAQTLLDLREKVKNTDVVVLTYKDQITAVMALAAGFGNSALHTEYDSHGCPEISRAEIEKLSKSKDQAKALAFLWESFKPTLEHLLTYNGPINQTPKELVKEAEWIAELIGVDLKAMFEDVCTRKGFTVPKSWADLNADGTPKGQKPAVPFVVENKS